VYFTVSKWHGDASVDDGNQSGFDDMSYAGDPRQFMEVLLS